MKGINESKTDWKSRVIKKVWGQTGTEWKYSKTKYSKSCNYKTSH